MYALPNRTLLNKQIPKKLIFKGFSLTPAQRNNMDADISRIDLIALFTQKTLPAIAQGESVKEICVMKVSLKKKDYHKESIMLLTKLIAHKILFVLSYEGETQLAITYEELHRGNWCREENLTIPIIGLDFDKVWEHIVAEVGSITIEKENTLVEQIAINKEKNKILEQIEVLKKKISKEKALNKQMKLRSEINQLKKTLNENLE